MLHNKSMPKASTGSNKQIATTLDYRTEQAKLPILTAQDLQNKNSVVTNGSPGQ